MENHHAINGKIQYKWQFSIAMLVYQRVIFKGILKRAIKQGKPHIPQMNTVGLRPCVKDKPHFINHPQNHHLYGGINHPDYPRSW